MKRKTGGAGCEESSHSGLADEDIIKALECCTTKGKSCKDCPAFAGVDRSDCKKFFLGALNLITRQKAEIERLTTAYPKTIESIKKMRDKAKAEAINEYVDRLTAELIAGGIYPAFVKGKIEKVKKEMVDDV